MIHTEAVSDIKTADDPEERDRSIPTHTPFLKLVSANRKPESTFPHLTKAILWLKYTYAKFSVEFEDLMAV